MTFPVYRRSIHNGRVVRFINRTSGTVVKPPTSVFKLNSNSPFDTVGFFFNSWIDCDDNKTWEPYTFNPFKD